MAITLAQLRARVQVLYDVTGSAILSDAQWNELVNDGIRAMWSDVTRINKDFRLTTVSFVLTSSQAQALAADFREIRAVRWYPGGTGSKPVYLNRETMRNGSQLWERTYRLQGTSLYIEPLGNVAGTYDYVYIAAAPTLAADGTNLDAELEQFQDYIVYSAVVAALSREESSIEQPNALFQLAKAALIGWASDQRSADPDTVDDVRRRPMWGLLR